MELSVVSSLYQSSPYIEEFLVRVAAAAEKVVDTFEVVLVNDGSPDDSLDAALRLQARFPNLTIIDLSRNFGHHKALMTGLAHARGDRVFLIDCDLEEPPELLLDWWPLLDAESDIDVVLGVQARRRGGWFERLSGEGFYRLMNALSPVKLPVNSVVARLMSARYVRELLGFADRELYLFGLMALAGFRQKAVPIDKFDKGSTSYSLLRRISLFVNALTSFSNYPLYIIFFLGISISLLAFAYTLFLVAMWLATPQPAILGWTTVVVSIWGIGGIVMTSLGVIGIYLAKMFVEVKGRPLAVVRRKYGARDGAVGDMKL